MSVKPVLLTPLGFETTTVVDRGPLDGFRRCRGRVKAEAEPAKKSKKEGKNMTKERRECRLPVQCRH